MTDRDTSHDDTSVDGNKDDYPANAHAGGKSGVEGKASATGTTVNLEPEEISQSQGKFPASSGEGQTTDAPGSPGPYDIRGPKSTGTPGGALGAPTEADLKRDQEQVSDRTDTRLPEDAAGS